VEDDGSARPRVIDADGHTFESPGWLRDGIDPAFRDRIQFDDAGRTLAVDGQPTMSQPPGALDALRFSPETVAARFGDIAADGFSAAAVVRALDVEGVDVSVIYGPLYECWREGMDPALGCAIARAYSRWLARYSADSGGRILGAAPIPLHDVDLAVAEVRYAYEELGIRAFWTRPNPVSGRMIGDDHFEPFFAALEGLDAPLSFHEGSGSLMQNIGSERFPEKWFEQHACVHPMEQQLTLASLVVRGVFERHPRLRVAFMECGAAWAPAWLHRLDEHFELVAWHDAPYLTMEPSEYFRRQCFVAAEPDEALLYQVIDALGVDNVVFATDFPHPDAKYPEAVERFLELPRVSTDDKRTIMWDNAVRFYGFDAASLPSASPAASGTEQSVAW
jgi:predicted TIM-barrel fold metal-dependent hydrolase